MRNQLFDDCLAAAAQEPGLFTLTGGFAYDSMLMGWIKEYISYLAPVYIYPGEDEMLSLAQGAIRVLKGQEEVQVY